MSKAATNRRIVMLAALFATLLAAALGRALWLQALERRRVRRDGRAPASRDRRRARRARHDRRPERRAARDRPPDDHRLREPAAGRAAARGRARDRPDARAPPRRRSSRSSPTARAASCTSRARPSRSRWSGSKTSELAGLGFFPEELRTYPQGPVAAHVLGFAGTDNKGLEGLERSLERTLAGRPGSRTIVKDPSGARARRRLHAAGVARAERAAHARPSDPGERRGGAEGDGAQLRRAVGVRDRHGSVHGRDPRHGRRARLQREPLPGDACRLPSQPRGHRHVRAGLDVQARHDRRRARGRDRLAGLVELPASADDQGRRPRDPRGARSPDAGSDGEGDRRALLERRARSRSRSGSARDGSRTGSSASASGQTDRRSTSRASRPGSRCRPASGPDRRSAPSRSATASR